MITIYRVKIYSIVRTNKIRETGKTIMRSTKLNSVKRC